MGLTTKQRKFAEAFASTGKLLESYRAAGYRIGKMSTAQRAAEAVKANPVVQSYLKELYEQVASKSVATRREILERLSGIIRQESQEEQVVVEQKVSASPVVLFFRIGKATLDSKELTNLEFYVRNAMKLDSDKTFTLIGSADKDTGNRELNQRLSEQRMEYVYDLLKNKYGVAPERLVRKAEGDTNNRFAEPELNRAVIVE